MASTRGPGLGGLDQGMELLQPQGPFRLPADVCALCQTRSCVRPRNTGCWGHFFPLLIFFCGGDGIGFQNFHPTWNQAVLLTDPSKAASQLGVTLVPPGNSGHIWGHSGCHSSAGAGGAAGAWQVAARAQLDLLQGTELPGSGPTVPRQRPPVSGHLVKSLEDLGQILAC